MILGGPTDAPKSRRKKDYYLPALFVIFQSSS